MSTKICSKCLTDKSLSEFHKHPKMSDGHVNKCKKCIKDYMHRKYQDNLTKEGWIEKDRKNARERYHRLNYKDTKKKDSDYSLERKRRYVENFPEKHRAQSLVWGSNIESLLGHLHHWSYNKEHYKDVIDISQKDHNKAHRFLIYDQERYMYRRNDTLELLDTRIKHKEYIKWILENKEN